MPLRDVVSSHPRILFVGINPSLTSERVGHHFASPGNPFWRLLHAAGLVPEPLEHSDDRRLPRFGLGITNLVPRATRSASELSDREMEAGREALLAKIAKLRPSIVAFVGLTVYQRVFRRASSGGAGAKPERIGSAHVFVLPNPSGLNASFPGFADKLVWYERLRNFASALSGAAVDEHMSGVPERRTGRAGGRGRSSQPEASVRPTRPAERGSKRLRIREREIEKGVPAREPAGGKRTHGTSADTPGVTGAGSPDDVSLAESRRARERRR